MPVILACVVSLAGLNRCHHLLEGRYHLADVVERDCEERSTQQVVDRELALLCEPLYEGSRYVDSLSPSSVYGVKVLAIGLIRFGKKDGHCSISNRFPFT